METCVPAIPFRFCEGKFDRLTPQSVARLNLRVGHFLSLGIYEFLAFQAFDGSTSRSRTQTRGSQWASTAVDRVAAIAIFPQLMIAVPLLARSVAKVQPMALRAMVTVFHRVPGKLLSRDLFGRLVLLFLLFGEG